MEKNRLGKTEMMVSNIGFGGFHLCEIPFESANILLNTYLDLGGNYVETAPSYGDGESEIKIGRAISHRRDEFYLATKVHVRDYEGAKACIEGSLKRLQTDYVDLLLMHAVGSVETVDAVLEGAIKAAEEARAAGQVKFIGISMHGEPSSLIDAINRYPFDVVMTTVNYYDDNNFPTIQGELIPLARVNDMGILLMKPLGDGYLYKSVELGFTYAFNQDVDVVVTGMNTPEMIKQDIDLANNYERMTKEEANKIRLTGPELGNYVCRQCGACEACPEGIDIQKIFQLEGLFDRQMARGHVANSAEFALAERLKHWFGTKDKAKGLYQGLDIDSTACSKCGYCESVCPYGLEIIQKLERVDYKLSDDRDKIFES